MSGQRGCSPTTSLAIATTAMMVGDAVQVPWGAVTPRPDPEDVCPRKSAVEGQQPNLVGRSPDGWQQLAKWNAFLDPTSDRPAWLPYKQCRNLAWKVSLGVANGLKVSRSEAFRVVQLVLLRARKRLCEYHTKGPWMRMLVDAIEQLPTVDWDMLDDDYDGYDGEPREGVVSEDMANARIGHGRNYDVPLKIWNDCAPSEVITQIRIWKAETSKYPVHPLTDLCKLSCKALLRDGLLHAPASDMDSNCYALVKPKNSYKCAFIVDMRNLSECKIKPHRSPLPTVADIFTKVEEMRHKGPVFGTTIDLTNFYGVLRMPAEMRDLFRLEGADFHSLPFGWNYSPLIAQETLGDLIRRYMGRFTGGGVVYFHYLDGILLLWRNRTLLRVMTRGLCEFLQA